MQDNARRLFVAMLLIASPQNQQPPTFRTQVDLVAVDVRATDARGRLVGDLTKDDFELLEDGKPQTISTFERIDIPISTSAAASRIIAPVEVRTNAAGVTGRLYLLVLDDVNTNFEVSGYVQKAAREFIEQHIEPGDVAGVAFISGRRNVSQDFTMDRQRLLKAVEAFSGLIPPPGTGGAAPVASGRGAFETLRKLADFLGTMKGRRKACVYIGEGFKPPGVRSGGQAKPGGVYAPSEQSQPDRYDYEELAAAANRANVNIYTIDPRGLSALAEAGAGGNAQGEVDTVLTQQDGMAWLAYSTDGFSVANVNDFSAPFTRIQRDQSSYLPAWVLPARQPEGRLLAQDRGAGETARGHRSRAWRVLRSRRRRRRRPPRSSPPGTSREPCCRRSTTRCR